jgi:probable rRNA maturation factor
MSSSDSDPPASLDVTVTDVLGRRVKDPGVGAWLRRVSPRDLTGRMSVVLASDATVRRLNQRYAGKNHATDVLSFPGESGDWLGDVVIAVGVSRRQARAAGQPWRTELRVLALHGLLHLLGYDHMADDGRMARVERRLRLKGGLDQALIERAAAKPTTVGGRARGVVR